VCAEILAAGGPAIVVYVLGTEQDPQGFAGQRRAFREAGCIVTETAARASLAAAAVARREPALAEVAL
jgi:FdrA protein